MPTTEVFPTARMWYCQLFIHESHVKLTMTTTMTLTIFFNVEFEGRECVLVQAFARILHQVNVFVFYFFIRKRAIAFSWWTCLKLEVISKFLTSFWSLLSESQVVTNLLGDVQTGRKWHISNSWFGAIAPYSTGPFGYSAHFDDIASHSIIAVCSILW